MGRFKRWLFRFLPFYMRESYEEENARLRRQVLQREQCVRELEAELRGLRYALRQRVSIEIGKGG